MQDAGVLNMRCTTRQIWKLYKIHDKLWRKQMDWKKTCWP